jgi:hypothetical protein
MYILAPHRKFMFVLLFAKYDFISVLFDLYVFI